MAQLVVAVAGAAVGFAIGGPTGAQIGFAVASTAYGVLNPPKGPSPTLQDLKATALQYGTAIPPVYGSPRVPGIVVWSSDKQVVESTEGGKGGGPEITSYTYKQDVLFMLADNEIADVRRIWSNGKLVWSQADDATDGTVLASEETPTWTDIEIFKGGVAQMPWTVYEAAVGAGNAPAMRGRACVGITGLNLGSSGYAPQLTFEIATSGTTDFQPTQLWEFVTTGGRNPNQVFVGSINPSNPYTLPIGKPNDYRYFPYGLYLDDRFSTLAAARAHGDSQVADNATDNFDNVTDIVVTETSVTIDTTTTPHRTEEIHEFYVTCLSNGSPASNTYLYALQYGSSSYTITPGEGVSREIGVIEVPLDMSTSGDNDNEGEWTIGSSDVAMVMCHAGTDDPVNRYGKESDDISYSYGNDTNPPWQYTRRGNRLYTVSRQTVWIKVFDTSTGGAPLAVSDEVTELSGGATWGMVCDGTTLYVAMPSNAPWGGVRRRDPVTLAYTDLDGDGDPVTIPYPPGAPGSGTRWWIFLDDVNDDVCLFFGQRVYRLDKTLLTWSLDLDLSGTDYDGELFIHPPAYRGNALFATQFVGSSGSYTTWQGLGIVERISREPVPLSEVVLDLCLRSGLQEAYVDVTELENTYVKALAVTQVTSARSVIEQLMAAYFFTATEGDVLKFVLRGADPVATLAYTELGAAEDTGANEALPISRRSDIEIPAQVAITYANYDGDYQQATEYSDRLIGAATGVVTAQFPLAFTAQEAKRIAETRLYDGALAATSIGPVGLSAFWSNIEPTDVLTVFDAGGSRFRTRVERITDAGGVRTLELAIDDASILSSEALSDDSYTGSTVVTRVGDTALAVLDIPILRDADDFSGYYVAVGPDAVDASWPGAAVFKSVDTESYVEQIRITDKTSIGETTTELGAWTGGIVFDEMNTVTVEVGSALANFSRDSILNGTADAYLIGDEVLYARTATLSTPGTYVLSGLLRGRRGTEWAITEHAIGDRVVLLQARGLRRRITANSDLGTTYNFKAPTLGRSIVSATAVAFADNGIALKPFAPVDLRATGGPSSYVITWSRRTRLSCRFTGSLGINVPLGEASESYSVEVYDGSDALISTATVSAETATVTAAAGYTVRVYQISATVGRGYPSEIEL